MISGDVLCVPLAAKGSSEAMKPPGSSTGCMGLYIPRSTPLSNWLLLVGGREESTQRQAHATSRLRQRYTPAPYATYGFPFSRAFTHHRAILHQLPAVCCRAAISADPMFTHDTDASHIDPGLRGCRHASLRVLREHRQIAAQRHRHFGCVQKDIQFALMLIVAQEMIS